MLARIEVEGTDLSQSSVQEIQAQADEELRIRNQRVDLEESDSDAMSTDNPDIVVQEIVQSQKTAMKSIQDRIRQSIRTCDEQVNDLLDDAEESMIAFRGTKSQKKRVAEAIKGELELSGRQESRKSQRIMQV